jgi:hypothetical protein
MRLARSRAKVRPVSGEAWSHASADGMPGQSCRSHGPRQTACWPVERCCWSLDASSVIFTASRTGDE